MVDLSPLLCTAAFLKVVAVTVCPPTNCPPKTGSGMVEGGSARVLIVLYELRAEISFISGNVVKFILKLKYISHALRSCGAVGFI